MCIYISFRESKVKEHHQESWRAYVKLVKIVVTVWVSSLTAILSLKYYWLESRQILTAYSDISTPQAQDGNANASLFLSSKGFQHQESVVPDLYVHGLNQKNFNSCKCISSEFEVGECLSNLFGLEPGWRSFGQNLHSHRCALGYFTSTF